MVLVSLQIFEVVDVLFLLQEMDLHVSMLTIVVICGHLKTRYLYMLCYLLSKNVPHKASMKLTNESYLAQYLSERKNIFQIEKNYDLIRPW